MNQTIILLFTILSVAAFGQAPQDPKESKFKAIKFSAYESGEMADFEATQKQLIKIFRSQDSLKGVFLQKFLVRNGVDLARLSQHQDSLKITSEGIQYILKSKQ